MGMFNCGIYQSCKHTFINLVKKKCSTENHQKTNPATFDRRDFRGNVRLF